MSEIILNINLSKQSVDVISYSYEECGVYGRGLVLDLLRNNIPGKTDRYSEDNVIVLVPGFFVGNKAPSACRMFVATAGGRGKGAEICNTTGNMPQKLGSLGIAGVVITGIADKPGMVVHIGKDGVSFNDMPELAPAYTLEIVSALKSKYNRNSAIIGTGKAGDMRLPLSTFFCTYPDGEPEYHSPRSGFGDVWGSKNLKALVVDCDECFGRECEQRDLFWECGKRLTKVIIEDEVCGGALPSYGSITLLKLLKGKGSIRELEMERKTGTLAFKTDSSRSSCTKTNKNCAPMCVIGCLNRHTSNDGERYSSPAEVETQAAIENCFGIKDHALAQKVQLRAIELGVVGTEFVTACKTFAEACGIEHGEEYLLKWLDEIEAGSLKGRVIASRTFGIAGLYRDKNLLPWIDRKAVQDESLFKIKMTSRYPGLSGFSELELMYAQIFVLENLGFCIFTSFAILDKPETFELMAEMFYARTGVRTTPETLIREANNVIVGEQKFEEQRWKEAQDSNIPPFTKVLYRYFDSKDSEDEWSK